MIMGGGAETTKDNKDKRRTNEARSRDSYRNREHRSVLVVASLYHLYGTTTEFQYRAHDGDADDGARCDDGWAARSTLGTGTGYEELVDE